MSNTTLPDTPSGPLKGELAKRVAKNMLLSLINFIGVALLYFYIFI
jgi:hypothetical protein